MKVAIINQPTNNRGDESAHKALMRSLIIRYPQHHFQVLFFGENSDSVKQMQIEGKNIEYFSIPPFRGITRLSEWALTSSFRRLLLLLHPHFRLIKNHIKSSDIVINAPGGICMGLFQNWNHLLWLQTAKSYKKPIAYYSRSFGPFPVTTKSNKNFKRISEKLLKSFDFLSIRDEKTMKLATEMGLEFIPAIDSAFLEKPTIDLPNPILQAINNESYIVFVPNSLLWQPAFRNASESNIFSLYLDLINILAGKYPKSKIVMMPQLFNSGNKNDVIYFEKLKEQSKHKEKIVVLPDTYSSDIQQNIIKNAHLVVGARYHSIVFAINNSVPFIALSYEHKMIGLLSMLKKSEYQIDITSIGRIDFEPQSAINRFDELLNTLDLKNDQARSQANSIAVNCFDKLCDKFIDKYAKA